MFAGLRDSMGEQVVLHGDLHHENVLRSGGGWVAIDPNGVIGARIRAWAWAQAHLAAAWSVADGEDPSYFLATAERLEPLMRR